MPQHRKPDPEKYCEYCGKRLERKRLPNGELQSLLHFNRQKYCNRLCFAMATDAKPSKSEDWSTTHYHARKEVEPGPCERCGKPNAKDVHHRDGNHLNNSRENLERICRSCHSKEHHKRQLCMVCGKPQKGLGYCEKHYQRFKKYGDPLLTKVNQHRPIEKATD